MVGGPPGDVQGLVFKNTGFGIDFECQGESLQFQVLGVGKLTYSAFSAEFVIMGLQ